MLDGDGAEVPEDLAQSSEKREWPRGLQVVTRFRTTTSQVRLWMEDGPYLGITDPAGSRVGGHGPLAFWEGGGPGYGAKRKSQGPASLRASWEGVWI